MLEKLTTEDLGLILIGLFLITPLLFSIICSSGGNGPWKH